MDPDFAESPRAVQQDKCDFSERFQVAGFWFDRHLTVHEELPELHVRGSTHLVHWGLEVCACALYVPMGVAAATGEDVMSPDVPKQLQLYYLRRFTGDQFRVTTRWSISRNGLDGTAVATGLQEFNPLYQDVVRGDCYTLSYDPRGDGNTSLFLNGRQLGEVGGREFSRALFSVWFGARPFLDKFKTELLRTPWH